MTRPHYFSADAILGHPANELRTQPLTRRINPPAAAPLMQQVQPAVTAGGVPSCWVHTGGQA